MICDQGHIKSTFVGQLTCLIWFSCYFRRMGSFTSAPKIANEDKADSDLELEPELEATRAGLLERCRRELASLPPQLKRSFTGRYQPQPGPETVRVLQWNLLSQGEPFT